MMPPRIPQRDENPAGIHLPLEMLPGHTSRGRLERILRRGEFAPKPVKPAAPKLPASAKPDGTAKAPEGKAA